MRLAKCDGDRCGATFPPHARFCPRCGKPVDVVVAPVSRHRGSFGRPRRGFPIIRIILLCWLAVFVLKSLRHSAPQPATSVPVNVFPPTAQSVSEVDAQPDLTSLDAFVAWRADHPSKQSRRQLEGRDIRWTGTLKKSVITGRYDLVQLDPQGKGSIRLLPVTDDAREDLRRLGSGTQIVIEGVLMDERSVHLVTVREVQ